MYHHIVVSLMEVEVPAVDWNGTVASTLVSLCTLVCQFPPAPYSSALGTFYDYMETGNQQTPNSVTHRHHAHSRIHRQLVGDCRPLWVTPTNPRLLVSHPRAACPLCQVPVGYWFLCRRGRNTIDLLVAQQWLTSKQTLALD